MSSISTHIAKQASKFKLRPPCTQQDIVDLYGALDAHQQEIVKRAVGHDSMSQAAKVLQITTANLTASLKDPLLSNAVFLFTYHKLPTQEAKTVYVRNIYKSASSYVMSLKEVNTLIQSNSNHLQELVADLPALDGDGKRKVLTTLIAYGMQTRLQEQSQVLEDGTALPPIYARADPKIALASLKEMNLMDNEYGELDRRATTSVESQADRIRRLATTADVVGADQRAAILDRMSTRDLEVVK